MSTACASTSAPCSARSAGSTPSCSPAGVGEHSAEVRAAALEPFAFLGLALDGERNERPPLDCDVATAASPVRVVVTHAREEWAIARAAAGVRLAGDADHLGGWPHLKRAA